MTDFENVTFKKIGLITNYNIYDKAGAAMTAALHLSEFGVELYAPTVNRDKILRMNRGRVKFNFLQMDELYATVDLLVVLGGDGSILESARRASARRTPILGINLGRMGYMAELEMDELDLLSHLFTDGGYNVEERSMLNISLIGARGNVKVNTLALNEAVITNGAIARIVDIELSEGDLPVASFHADGLIIATPTGSTAYSLSAGGPIADPRVRCFCVTPICPHSLATRPMIFPDNTQLCVKNTSNREKMLYLTVDGRVNYELYRGETVKISRADAVTHLIRIKNCGFYRRLRLKMSEK